MTGPRDIAVASGGNKIYDAQWPLTLMTMDARIPADSG